MQGSIRVYTLRFSAQKVPALGLFQQGCKKVGLPYELNVETDDYTTNNTHIWFYFNLDIQYWCTYLAFWVLGIC